MPPAKETALVRELLCTLIYGPSKARKSTWAILGALGGFNVTYLDGDKSAHLFSAQPPIIPMEIRDRIMHVRLHDDLGRAVFAPFMAQFFRRDNVFTWDEQDRIQRSSRMSIRPDHSHLKIDPNKFTENDILIIDSWTKLAESCGWSYAEEKDIDIADAAKTDWDGYGFQGRFLDFVMKSMHSMKCHVIVIAHSTVYEKWDRRDKKNPKLEWQKTIAISSSGPHGMKLPKNFSDVLYFDRLSELSTIINAGGTQDRDGGSRILPPQKFKWEDMPLARLLDIAGFKGNPAQPCEAVKWFPPGENPFGEAPQKSSVSLPVKSPNGTGNGSGAVRAAEDGSPTLPQEPPQPIQAGSSMLARLKMKQQ